MIIFRKSYSFLFILQYINAMASESYSDIEDQIQLALSIIKPGETPNLAALAWGWDLPYQQLRMRYKGRGTCQNCGADWILSDDQELALCHIIEWEEADETELQQWQLQSHVNWILAQDYPDSTDSSTVGKCWVLRFLQWHFKYKIQVLCSLANKWKWSHNIDNLKKWFDSWESLS